MHHSQQIDLASVDITGGITSMWNTFTTWVPRFVGFLAILVIGWIIAKVIGKAVETVLRRLHFERVMERAGMSQMLERSKYDGPSLCGAIAKYIVLLIVLQLAFGVFGSNPINNVIHSVIAWIPRGLVALAIIVVTALIARVVRDLVTAALSSLSYGRMLGNLAALCIVFLGVVAALGQAEIATTITGPVLVAVLATVAGVIIVGVGGGMVRPMQERWERMLGVAEREAGNVRGSMQSSGAIGSRMSGAGMSGSSEMSGPGMAGGAAGGAQAYAAGHAEGSQAAREAAEEAERRARQGREGMGGDQGGTGAGV